MEHRRTTSTTDAVEARDRNCKNKYISEEELIDELLKIMDV